MDEDYFAGKTPRAIEQSQRTIQCLYYASQGMTAEETARAIYCDKATVYAHLRRARKKLGARSTAQAIATALRLGLID